MAKYPAMITTNKGRDLVSRSNATKKAITWTKIVVGDGDNNNNIATLTNVISKKLEITVDKTSDLTNGQWKVQGTIDNSTLTEGFYCKEIAVFAKCEGDTDEILFAYTNGGNYVDYIPDKTTPVDSQKVTCQFVVSNAQNVTVTMNNEAFLRQEDLDNHDADNNAHQPLLNKWINKSFSKFKEAVIGVVKDALTDILDIQAKMDTNGFVRMGFLWGFTIQWGRRTELTIYDNYKYEESFPIAFDQKCIGVLVTLEGRGPVSGASVAYTDNRSLTEFTIVADASNAVAKSDLFYIAIGA